LLGFDAILLLNGCCFQ